LKSVERLRIFTDNLEAQPSALVHMEVAVAEYISGTPPTLELVVYDSWRQSSNLMV
jgi:hypothetical protein